VSKSGQQALYAPTKQGVWEKAKQATGLDDKGLRVRVGDDFRYLSGLFIFLVTPLEPLNVRVDETPNRAESTVNGGCQGTHSRGGRKSNQRNNQHILHQALAFLFPVDLGENT
jgi:hypothetical protein